MKLLKIMVAIMITGTLASCSRSSDDLANPTTISTDGSWKVSFYWDKKDETSNFSGWSFAFNSGGTAVATKGSSTVNGTWSQTSSKFILSFGSDPVLSAINSNWLIVEKTTSVIKLKDDNPAQDDQLTFSKF
jgi:hypothetical protein